MGAMITVVALSNTCDCFRKSSIKHNDAQDAYSEPEDDFLPKRRERRALSDYFVNRRAKATVACPAMLGSIVRL